MTLRRTFPFPRADVFAAWTDPEELAAWWGGAIARTLSAAVDLRVGGAYRLTMRSAGEVFAVEGVFREVRAPERLVYTWRWDGLDVDGGRESLVTVEFIERDGSTEVVVTHDGLESDESLRFHDRGWTTSLARLGEVLR